MEMFKKSDLITKVSLFIFGFGNIVRGQIGRGLVLLGLQIGYVLFLLFFGLNHILMLPSLGKTEMGRYFDESIGIYITTQGDNSMLILLFGVISVFVTLCFLLLAGKSMKSAYDAQLILQSGKKPPSLLQDLKGLLDKNLHSTLLTLPVIGVISFTVLPVIFMVLMAFTNFDRFHQPPGNLFTWVGFENFKNIFWQNPRWAQTFFRILGWTFIWAIFATFTNFIFGMIVSLMINKKGIKLKKMWRTFFVMTIAVPQFVSLMLMARLLNDLGPVNILLDQIHRFFGNTSFEAVKFLSDGNLARVTVILVNMWVGIPYTILATTGILMNIPEEQYEACRIDGANVLQEFFKITLPHMIFVMTPALITAFVGNINNFNVIFFLTGGGPNSLDYFQGGQTDLLVTWLYKLTVNEQNYSLASTIGIIIFIITATLSLIFYNHSGSIKREEEMQ